MPTISALTWVLVFVCAGLSLALAAAWRRVSALSGAAAGSLPRSAAGWERLDELLSGFLKLQERGLSRSGAVSREDFCVAVLECALSLTKAGGGSMMLFEDAQGELTMIASRGLDIAAGEKFSLKPGEGIAGRAFSTGQAIVVAEPFKDPRYVDKGPGGIMGAEPLVSVPLVVKSRPIGVLNLHAENSGRIFNEYEVKFLTLLAGEAAIMLKNLELMDDLERFYLEMVQTLARAVDSKDAYTHEHSDRARAKARRLANELKLPDSLARHVEYAALLHDIGKIGIDEAILLKPGKLTSEEYEVMKRHPAIGHQILSPVKYLGPVAQMVLHHQEWFNGQGYPDGLKGEEIPLGARIVAVIDAWDAMTSDRPYRKALGRAIAVAELKRGAGTQFDPKVVEVFLRLETSEWSREPRE